MVFFEFCVVVVSNEVDYRLSDDHAGCSAARLWEIIIIKRLSCTASFVHKLAWSCKGEPNPTFVQFAILQSACYFCGESVMHTRGPHSFGVPGGVSEGRTQLVDTTAYCGERWFAWSTAHDSYRGCLDIPDGSIKFQALVWSIGYVFPLSFYFLLGTCKLVLWDSGCSVYQGQSLCQGCIFFCFLFGGYSFQNSQKRADHFQSYTFQNSKKKKKKRIRSRHFFFSCRVLTRVLLVICVSS